MRGGDSSAVTGAMLADALAEGQLRLVYQPKVDCRTMKPSAFEALARWQLPDGREVPPSVFIPLAEDHDLVAQLTVQLSHEAIHWIHRFPDEDELLICINLSAETMDDTNFIDEIVACCRDVGVAPHRIIFELNENRHALDHTRALDFVTRLRLHGFSIAIDDVGSGHSAFLRLGDLPFTEMKIDRALVANVEQSLRLKVILQNLVALGHSLDLLVVAEGVENEESFELVRESGCDLIQGYYIAPPLAPEAAEAWYFARRSRRWQAPRSRGTHRQE